MSQTTPQGQLGLLTIPVDILYEITTHLDYPSALQLAGTSRGLRHTLHPSLTSPEANFPLPVKVKQRSLRYAERVFKQNIRNLACFTCMRMLPRDAFNASNRCGDRGKGSLKLPSLRRCRRHRELKDVPGLELEGHHQFRLGKNGRGRERKAYWAKRFCWDCGIKHLRFPHMEGVRRYPSKRSREPVNLINLINLADPLHLARVARERAEEVWYLCHQCGEMKTKNNMCLPAPWAHLDEGDHEEKKARGHPKMLCSGIFDDDLHRHN